MLKGKGEQNERSALQGGCAQPRDRPHRQHRSPNADNPNFCVSKCTVNVICEIPNLHTACRSTAPSIASPHTSYNTLPECSEVSFARDCRIQDNEADVHGSTTTAIQAGACRSRGTDYDRYQVDGSQRCRVVLL